MEPTDIEHEYLEEKARFCLVTGFPWDKYDDLTLLELQVITEQHNALQKKR